MSHSKNAVTLVLATIWATKSKSPPLGWLMVTVGVPVYFLVDNELVGTIALNLHSGLCAFGPSAGQRVNSVGIKRPHVPPDESDGSLKYNFTLFRPRKHRN